MGPALARPVVRPRPRSRMAMPRVLVREGLRGPADQHGPRTQAAQVPRGRLRLAGRYRRADGALRLSPLGLGQRAAELCDGLAEPLEAVPELLQPPDGGALGGRTADVLLQPAEVRLLAGLVVVTCVSIARVSIAMVSIAVVRRAMVSRAASKPSLPGLEGFAATTYLPKGSRRGGGLRP